MRRGENHLYLFIFINFFILYTIFTILIRFFCDSPLGMRAYLSDDW